jgi:transcriptional regulator with XRE-family HTH domain
MISGYQARMARAALGVSREMLAKQSGVSVAALQAFENGKRMPQERTLRDIQRALEGYGLEFIDRGVRVSSSTHKELQRASVD